MEQMSLIQYFIPIYAAEYPTFDRLLKYFSHHQDGIDGSPITSLTRTLTLATCLARGQREDYETITAPQPEQDRLTRPTFERLKKNFAVFNGNKWLFDLFEVFAIVECFSQTKLATRGLSQQDKDEIAFIPLYLIENYRIDEVSSLDVKSFSIIREACLYSSQVKQALSSRQPLPNTKAIPGSAECIAIGHAICNFAGALGPADVSGSLTLTESATIDLLDLLWPPRTVHEKTPH